MTALAVLLIHIDDSAPASRKPATTRLLPAPVRRRMAKDGQQGGCRQRHGFSDPPDRHQGGDGHGLPGDRAERLRRICQQHGGKQNQPRQKRQFSHHRRAITFHAINALSVGRAHHSQNAGAPSSSSVWYSGVAICILDSMVIYRRMMAGCPCARNFVELDAGEPAEYAMRNTPI